VLILYKDIEMQLNIKNYLSLARYPKLIFSPMFGSKILI